MKQFELQKPRYKKLVKCTKETILAGDLSQINWMKPIISGKIFLKCWSTASTSAVLFPVNRTWSSYTITFRAVPFSSRCGWLQRPTQTKTKSICRLLANLKEIFQKQFHYIGRLAQIIIFWIVSHKSQLPVLKANKLPTCKTLEISTNLCNQALQLFLTWCLILVWQISILCNLAICKYF